MTKNAKELFVKRASNVLSNRRRGRSVKTSGEGCRPSTRYRGKAVKPGQEEFGGIGRHHAADSASTLLWSFIGRLYCPRTSHLEWMLLDDPSFIEL